MEESAQEKTYADVCWRMLTYADVCRMVKEMEESAQEKTYADVC
jgi:hypothetical protein